MQFRLRRVHFFFAKKKKRNQRKISPQYCRKTPPRFTKLTAAQIRHPWLNFALRDILSLHSPILQIAPAAIQGDWWLRSVV